MQSPLRDRIIGIGSVQLRRIPEVIAIAYGTDKVSTAYAALCGGCLHALVTHTTFAEQLLALDNLRNPDGQRKPTRAS